MCRPLARTMARARRMLGQAGGERSPAAGSKVGNPVIHRPLLCRAVLLKAAEGEAHGAARMGAQLSTAAP